MKIEVCNNREEAQEIINGLNVYNKQKEEWFLDTIHIPIELIAKKNNGEIIGGVLGFVGYYAGFYIRTFWVSEQERGKGLGSKLLQKAEEMAKEKGAVLANVDTFSFQADGFYQKYGYEEIGRIKDYPKAGQSHVYFKKEL